LEEQLIIERIIAGEKELYELLVRRYNQTLYRVMKGFLHDESDIEEMMQISYIKAFEKLSTFNMKSKFSTWLIRIAINEALQLNKKNIKYSSIDFSDIGYSDISLKNPEQLLIMNESTQIYEQAISELDPIYKSVFILKEIDQMSIKDISESLEISESNVKVRLHRAKTQIKDILYTRQARESAFEFGNKRCDNIVANVMKTVK
jgi:RNA polymerase sigma-70 factor (ECF subfamily)